MIGWMLGPGEVVVFAVVLALMGGGLIVLLVGLFTSRYPVVLVGASCLILAVLLSQFMVGIGAGNIATTTTTTTEATP